MMGIIFPEAIDFFIFCADSYNIVNEVCVKNHFIILNYDNMTFLFYSNLNEN